jgi:hypothetical protein
MQLTRHDRSFWLGIHHAVEAQSPQMRPKNVYRSESTLDKAKVLASAAIGKLNFPCLESTGLLGCVRGWVPRWLQVLLWHR